MVDLNKELHRIDSTAIIYSGRKYLITQRSYEKKAFPGRWTVPGGGLETDDYTKNKKTTSDAWYFSITIALRREIKEETNLEVGEFNYLLDLTFIRPDHIPSVVLSYFVPYKSGKVKLDHDSINFAWVTVKEAKKYDLISGIFEEIALTDLILSQERSLSISLNRAKLLKQLLSGNK